MSINKVEIEGLILTAVACIESSAPVSVQPEYTQSSILWQTKKHLKKTRTINGQHDAAVHCLLNALIPTALCLIKIKKSTKSTKKKSIVTSNWILRHIRHYSHRRHRHTTHILQFAFELRYYDFENQKQREKVLKNNTPVVSAQVRHDRL